MSRHLHVLEIFPCGEIRNDNSRNTQPPSICPMKNNTILSNTPMPDTISKRVLAQQNRKVKAAMVIVRMTTSGAAIILNSSFAMLINNSPFIVALMFASTYILP